MTTLNPELTKIRASASTKRNAGMHLHNLKKKS